MSNFSFHTQPCGKTRPVHVEKMSVCVKRVRSLPCIKTIKTSKEITETSKTGLKRVQHVTNNWKDSGGPSYARTKYSREKNPDCDQRKSRKTAAELWLCFIVKVRTFPNAKETQLGIGTEQLCSSEKTTNH